MQGRDARSLLCLLWQSAACARSSARQGQSRYLSSLALRSPALRSSWTWSAIGIINSSMQAPDVSAQRVARQGQGQARQSQGQGEGQGQEQMDPLMKRRDGSTKIRKSRSLRHHISASTVAVAVAQSVTPLCTSVHGVSVCLVVCPSALTPSSVVARHCVARVSSSDDGALVLGGSETVAPGSLLVSTWPIASTCSRVAPALSGALALVVVTYTRAFTMRQLPATDDDDL